MPYELYKVAHLAGILMIFLSLGGQLLHAINGGSKETNTWRKPLGIMHGIGLVLALVAGFGLLARVGSSPLEGWVIAKIVIWVLLGGLVGIATKWPQTAKPLWIVVLALGILAAYLANTKPF